MYPYNILYTIDNCIIQQNERYQETHCTGNKISNQLWNLKFDSRYVFITLIRSRSQTVTV